MSAAIHHLTHLTVEHLSDPIGLATAQPRFAWRIAADASGVHQQAYELEVDGLWSSGRVESKATSAIAYDGPTLDSATAYTWRVRCWIVGGHSPSDWATGSFETSLLNTNDWIAQWVVPAQEPTLVETYSLGGALSGMEAPASPAAERLHPPQQLRQEFDSPSAPLRARLYASARGVYRAEINGTVVGDEVLAPGHDSYPSRLSFQTYDVTGLVQVGANALGVVVADGWWTGRIGLTGSSANYGDRLGAIWQLVIDHADGSTTTVVSGADVTSSRGPWSYADLFIGERYDATVETPGWSTAGFDARDWTPVAVEEGGRETLVPFIGEPVRRILEFTPESILTTPSGDTVIDLGQVIAGRLRLRLDLPRGTEVVLEHSEVLTAEGEYFSNIMGPNKDQHDVYVSAGGPAVWEPEFTFHGFRYVRLTGASGLTVDDVTAVVIGSDLRETGSFSSSDTRINRLHQNVLWSQRANFLSVPTDCPQRERAGWTGDLQVFMPAATTNMDVLPFVERWLANLRVDQLADGQVPNIIPVIPSIGAGDAAMGIGASSAAWGDAVAIVPWVLWERYADDRPLRENYAAMQAWVDYQMRTAEAELPPRFAETAPTPEQEANHRLLWNTGFHFGDWLAPSTLLEAPMPDSAMIAPARTAEIVAAMFHANSLKIIADTAEVIGKAEDAARYRDRHRRVREAFIAEYVDSDGRLPVAMQGPYVNALAFGLIPDELRPRSVAHLVELVRAAGDHLDTGFVSVPYLLDVLWEGGERDLARRLLHQDTAPGWLYEVDKGATTIWEAWEAIAPDGTVSPMSMNHYAFGCVDDWLYRRVAGLQPAQPGFRHSRIEPDVDGLFASASARHTTPHGDLAVDWHREGNEVSVVVEVPHNTTAELVLGGAVEQLESGRHERRVAV